MIALAQPTWRKYGGHQGSVAQPAEQVEFLGVKRAAGWCAVHVITRHR